MELDRNSKSSKSQGAMPVCRYGGIRLFMLSCLKIYIVMWHVMFRIAKAGNHHGSITELFAMETVIKCIQYSCLLWVSLIFHIFFWCGGLCFSAHYFLLVRPSYVAASRRMGSSSDTI